jgi:hypothetical protein
MSDGNHFQRPRENQAIRDFHISTIFTPYGGTGAAEHRRPTRPLGAQEDEEAQNCAHGASPPR